MRVIKRSGQSEPVSFDKVLQRIRRAARGLLVNSDALAQQVLARLYDGCKTEELDELTAQLAASLTTNHPDWGTLSARIAISNHHKKTSSSFSYVMKLLGNQVHPKTKERIQYIHNSILELLSDTEVCKRIDSKIDYQRDYDFDFFGFKTLERAYLLKDANMKIQERPQHLWMRVALALWHQDLDRAFETYDLLSQKKFTHATPTLFAAGTPRQQLSSCYLLAMDSDSITGIYKTLSDCAQISKYAGGIGLHVHNIRAKGSLIKGTNGISNGLVPLLRVFNNTARYVDQCFTPDTTIFTEQGIKTIENVSFTDKVLCSDGKYHYVKQPIRHDYNGQMFEIQIKNSLYPVRVTGEHQVLALKNQAKGLNFSVIKNRLKKNIVKEEFFDVKDLVKGDFLVYKIPSYEKDILVLSEEDCRFYGILVGDGHVSEDKTSYVSLNETSKVKTYNFVCEYLSNRGVHYSVGYYDNNVRVVFSSNSPGFKFTRSQLYDQNKQKKIDYNFLHLPKNKILQIIRGVIETDGCVGTKEISIEMTSYNVIESIRYMMLRLGALCSGYERNRVGQVSSTRDIFTNLPTVVARIPRIPEILELFPDAPKGEHFSYLKYNNKIYSRIQDITEVEYSGTVHDFEIEDPHDYTVAHLGIAHNGGGKRNGSFAIYLEPWHADIEDFLKLKLNTGTEEERARDLFYALWISDLFMKRVEENGEWSLFCPDEAPGLADVWGEKFEELYLKYEQEGVARKKIPAQKLWFDILDAQMETGTPYLVYKDAANRKSNQQNLGTIKSSNLCVAPETPILTKDGIFPISELVDQEVNVWNGDKWSKTIVRKTGENQPVISVDIVVCTIDKKTAESYPTMRHIECTPYHKFILQGDDYNNRIEAKDLKRGMELKEWVDNNGEIYEAVVWNVVDYKRSVDTYCFNEPENHAGVFNGVLTGNCSEIIEYSSPEETAVCNLASLSLPAFIKNGAFDYDELRRVVKVVIKNLNRVIDINFYPTPETERSNMRHRPVGLGVQGLADVFAILKLNWESEEAARVNRLIFEHIYYASIEASHEAALEEGPYSSFKGSPSSEGRLQPDLWSVEPLTQQEGTLNWDGLREKAKQGIRNSLLIAPMPTASTSQILGNNECFEPFTSNLYTRRTLAGEFIIVNKYLMEELRQLGIWSEELKQEIIARNGSVQGISKIPDDIQARYKTGWELKQRVLIDMAAARGAFIDQSQSLNLFVPDPTYSKLTSMHFYAWKSGLKTGCYYLRTKAPVMAQKFTVDPRLLAAVGTNTEEDSKSESESEEEYESEEESTSDTESIDERKRKRELEEMMRKFKESEPTESDGCLMCGS